MEKTIVYPFEPGRVNNKLTYARAFQFARQLGAKLILFTALPEPFDDDDLDGVYLHLLELDGYYQTMYNQWAGPSDVTVQRVIQIGELTDRLREWLRRKPADYVVCQPHSFHLNREALCRRLLPAPLPQFIGEG